MGKVSRNNQTLRGKFIASFHFVLFKSIVATILTWILLVFSISMLFSTNKLNPANYYENQLSTIEQYVDDVGEPMLFSKSQVLFESIIPLEGIDYQVIDLDGQIVYGTYQAKLVSNEKELQRQIATRPTKKDGGFIKFYPIKDEQGTLQGAVVLKYSLSLLTSNLHNQWMIVFFMIIVFFISAPFISFYLFSYISGKRLSREFERPFHELIESTKKIKEQDLDFTLPEINYFVELEQLVQAFEEMRSALKDSLDRQLQLEQERKEMIAAISHDLRNPLTIIQGHAEGLLESKKKRPERFEPYLQTIIRNTNYASHLIAELNEMALIEKPTFTLNPKRTSINEFVQMKGEEYERLCEKKSIDFQYRMANEEIYIRKIDQERISQVLDNIVTNSIRYTPFNGHVEWITTMNPDQSITFDIYDNGPGFSGDQKQDVLDKYYQEESKESEINGLSGLGLYIAKEIVKKHGGEIHVNNREIGGAHVKVRICEL